MTGPYSPEQVIPRALARAVHTLPYWFVIGGQAVRCFAPYRPSRDVLETHRQGIVAALSAMRAVYRTPVEEGLLLRALTYFDDADREAPLPGEGATDWERVRRYFLVQVGHLLVPPPERLAIQDLVVDVSSRAPRSRAGSTRRAAASPRSRRRGPRR